MCIGIFGDTAPGSPEERAAKREADKGLAALGQYQGKVEGRQADIGQYYEGQQGLVGQQYDLKEEGILVPFRKNFLPGFWQKGAMTDDLSFSKMFDEYFLKSAKSKEYKGSLATEKNK